MDQELEQGVAKPRSRALAAKRQAAAARCDAMVQAAREQILAVGVDRFKVNAVLRQSGGSKATLVKYFGDRTGLIAAAIRAEARLAMAALELDTASPTSLPLDAALCKALDGVLRFYLSQGALALYRAVVGATGSDHSGAEAFYSEGHATVVGTVAELLEHRKGLDVRSDLDCRDVADQLVHAIRAGLYERALIGIEPEPMQEPAIRARVAATVALIVPGILRPPRVDQIPLP